MTERVSTLDVRQRLGDMLNRVALRHDEFVIERKGKPLAALVSIERLEQMRGIARRHAVEFLAISEFPKWSKYLILLSFQDNSSARSVQIGGWM